MIIGSRNGNELYFPWKESFSSGMLMFQSGPCNKN